MDIVKALDKIEKCLEKHDKGLLEELQAIRKEITKGDLLIAELGETIIEVNTWLHKKDPSKAYEMEVYNKIKEANEEYGKHISRGRTFSN